MSAKQDQRFGTQRFGMQRLGMHRRQMLRGAGGLLLGLPILDAMFAPKAFAGAAPMRYLVLFGGVSIGSEQGGNLLVPDAPGALTAPLKTALEPLEAMKSDFSIISGLSMPKGNDGSNIPAGGRYGRASFHDESVGVILSGVRSPQFETNDAQGPSSDFLVAQQLGGATPHAQLSLRTQAANYGGHLVPLTWRDGNDGIEPTTSPAQLFDTLFANLMPNNPETPVDPAEELKRRKHASVLDLVRKDTERLLPKLGAFDRARLGEHLAAIDKLYSRVSAIGTTPTTESCMKPDAVGNLPGVGSGYSGEDERASVFVDLLHMALACDLTRVASLAISEPMSMMTVPSSITGTDEQIDLHELGHGATSLDHARGFRWHTKHLAALMKKLKETPDTTGTLLDNTVIVFLTEGGSGNGAPHNTEDMAVLVAGGKGKIRQGQHIVAKGQHPCRAIVSAMNAVGVSTTSFGEVNGGIDGLLV